MRSLALTLIAPVILISAGTDPAWSQEKGAVALRAVAEMEVEVVNDNGEKEMQRIPAQKVVPGDVVVYTIYYTNNGSEPAENFVITNPVPEHMIYLSSSADGENSEITYSVDGGNSYDLPGKLTVANSEGQQKPAEVSDYTHIRWTMNEPVAPNESGFVNFKAQLE